MMLLRFMRRRLRKRSMSRSKYLDGLDSGCLEWWAGSDDPRDSMSGLGVW
jgi:hypothetical protein